VSDGNLGRREQVTVRDDPLTLPSRVRDIDLLSEISKGWWDVSGELQVPWEITLLVTFPQPLSDVLTLNITPVPVGYPFRLQLLAASYVKWPLTSVSTQRG
jgi:hypothetical protein